jgi:hypothetical protein
VNGVDPLGQAAGHLSATAVCTDEHARDMSSCIAHQTKQEERGPFDAYDTCEAASSGPEALGLGLAIATGGIGDLIEALTVSAEAGEASVVAGEAADAGDHIVLGLRDYGLEQTAAKVGGRTLLNDPEWQNTLQQAIANPSTKFTVALDGLSGSSPYSQVMSAVQNGLTPAATPTNWELAQLYQAGRLPAVNFVEGGQSVINPFGG